MPHSGWDTQPSMGWTPGLLESRKRRSRVGCNEPVKSMPTAGLQTPTGVGKVEIGARESNVDRTSPAPYPFSVPSMSNFPDLAMRPPHILQSRPHRPRTRVAQQPYARPAPLSIRIEDVVDALRSQVPVRAIHTPTQTGACGSWVRSATMSLICNPRPANSSSTPSTPVPAAQSGCAPGWCGSPGTTTGASCGSIRRPANSRPS